jgi:MFS family permease
VVLPLFVVRDLGGDEVLFTLLFSVLSLGSFVGALLVARRTDVQVRSVAVAALAFGVSMMAMAGAPNRAAAFVAAVLMGLASIAFLTSSTTIVQLRTDPSMRGRVLALQAMVVLGSTPIGGPIVGFIAEHAGARWSLALGGVACLLAGAWGFSVAPRGRSEPTTSERQLAEHPEHTDAREHEADEVVDPAPIGVTSTRA